MPIRSIIIGSASTRGEGHVLFLCLCCFYDSVGFIYHCWGICEILLRTNLGQTEPGCHLLTVFLKQFPCLFYRIRTVQCIFFCGVSLRKSIWVFFKGEQCYLSFTDPGILIRFQIGVLQFQLSRSHLGQRRLCEPNKDTSHWEINSDSPFLCNLFLSPGRMNPFPDHLLHSRRTLKCLQLFKNIYQQNLSCQRLKWLIFGNKHKTQTTIIWSIMSWCTIITFLSLSA